MPVVAPAEKGTVDATVFIPTFNGEKYLDRLLTAVEQQDFPGTVEILIIDSGSTDATLEIIARHPMVRLVQITQADFGHGKTRNQAAQLARGKKIAYLSHDAVPASRAWLTELLAPLDEPGCAAAYGKQIARRDCFPSLKYEIAGVFAAGGPDGVVTYVEAPGADVSALTGAELFYSDVNSATTRKFLTEQIAYRDLPYSEDLAFAKDVLAAGYRKAYVPGAVVEHSNDVTFSDYGKRIFDESMGRRRLGELSTPIGLGGMLARMLRDILRTDARILRDHDFSFATTLRWLMVNPAYIAKKWVNIRRASCVDLNDESAISRYSLETSRFKK